MGVLTWWVFPVRSGTSRLDASRCQQRGLDVNGGVDSGGKMRIYRDLREEMCDDTRRYVDGVYGREDNS